MFSVDELMQRAVSLHQHGQLLDAERLYRSVLALQPNNPDALHLAGVVAAQTHDFERAVDLISRAVRLNRRQAAYHSNLGISLQALKRFDEALKSFDRAISMQPNFPDALNNRGSVHRDMGHLDAAIADYDKALAFNPGLAEAHNNRGNVFKDLGQIQEALACYDSAIRLRPGYLEALNNKGAALVEAKRFLEGIPYLEEAIRLYPSAPDPHANLGTALLGLRRLDEAVKECITAVRLKPSSAQFNLNAGNALKEKGQLDEAMQYFSQAHDLDPAFSDAALNKGLMHLLFGEFLQGWPLYEARRYKKGYSTVYERGFQQPVWKGEPIDGKTILLHSEQGFGDVIHFCRYARLIAERGARVVLEAPRTLLPLLKGVEGVDTLVALGDALPRFDVYAPLMSVPGALRTTLEEIPASRRYLRSAPSRVNHWMDRLGPSSGRRVGLAWSGNPNHQSDAERSIPLVSMAPLFRSGHEFIALQTEIRDRDREAMARFGVRSFGAEIRDFSDTAALCDLCDVVISVDTSVAHLSSALGRPTWILLAAVPDWRWMLARDDSPWYPTVRLFRQTGGEGWDPVLERISNLLSGNEW